MTTIPKSATEPAEAFAASFFFGVTPLAHKLCHFLTESEISSLVSGVISAALPHLGEPIAYTTPGEIDRVRNHLTNKLVASTSVAWATTGVPLYLAPPAPALPEGWKLVPVKPTEAMAYAAACAHYGKRRVDKTGVGGISMTVNDIDYSFPHAFRKFWMGALAAAPQPLFAADPDSSTARFGAVRPPRTVRHKKRGSTYEVIGAGKMQTQDWSDSFNGPGSADMKDVTVYRCLEDGSIWVRPSEEFEDGRFEDVAPRSPALPSAVQPDTPAPEAREVFAVAKAIAEGR